MATTLLFALSLVQASVGVSAAAVADAPGLAQAVDGQYISWREHLIDDSAISGIELSGSDGFVLGDVDGDGWEDIVSVHESDSSYDGNPDGDVRIAFGSADPLQWTNITLAEGRAAAAPEDAALADVNGDGHLDVLSASYVDDSIRWHEHSGSADPVFTAHVISATEVTATSVFAADFDGDGDVDVFSAAYGEDAIRWHENGGGLAPTFTTRDVFTGAINATSVFVADMDGDGDADIVSASEGDGTIRWYETDGVTLGGPIRNPDRDETYQTIAEGIGAGASDELLEAPASQFVVEPVIDFEGKGIDLRSYSSTMQPAAGQLTLSNGATLESGGRAEARFLQVGPTQVLLGAAFPGGDEDLVLNGMTMVPDGATAEFRIGSLSLGSEGTMCVGSLGTLFITSLDGADLQGTLALDGFSVLTFDGDVSLDSDSLLPLRVIDGERDFRSVVAADVDGDGDVDLVVAEGQEFVTDRVALYQNGGAPDFEFELSVIDQDQSGLPQGFESVAAADFDGDGDVDVLAAAEGEREVYLYINSDLPGATSGLPGPMFTRRTVATGRDFRYIASVDLDGDDDIDFLTSSSDGSGLEWYENDGGASPVFGPRSIAANEATRMSPVDLDGDGDMDFIAASTGEVLWFRNNGAADPVFERRQVFRGPALDTVTSTFPIDFDGDGDVDVLSSALSDVIRLHENDGAALPAFTTQEILVGVTGTVSVVGVDLDGDGRMDVLTAASEAGVDDGQMLWHRAIGSLPPSFTTQVLLAGSQEGSSGVLNAVMTPDLDGDGRPDVLQAAGAALGDSLRWLRNDIRSTQLLDAATLSILGSLTNNRQFRMTNGVVFADGGMTNTGAVVGSGSLHVEGETLTNDGTLTVVEQVNVFGTCQHNGTILVQSGLLTVFGPFRSAGGATLIAASGSEIVIRGDSFNCRINANTRFDLASATLGIGADLGTTRLEAMSVDIGASVAGLDRTMAGHYPLGTLRIGLQGTPVSASVVDAHDNANDGQVACEAIYASSVIIEAGATLNTNGCHVYYETLVLDGAVDDPSNLMPIAAVGGSLACLGDANADAVVNFADLEIVLSAWGTSDASGDVFPFPVGDGVVNFMDLELLLDRWNSTCE
ncbi:MAG: VCBS repeat-containing protein [Phycisphaerales bacterium]|nr:VCBS repeat-containing protein [Phycisphaerales bacterium]